MTSRKTEPSASTPSAEDEDRELCLLLRAKMATAIPKNLLPEFQQWVTLEQNLCYAQGRIEGEAFAKNPPQFEPSDASAASRAPSESDALRCSWKECPHGSECVHAKPSSITPCAETSTSALQAPASAEDAITRTPRQAMEFALTVLGLASLAIHRSSTESFADSVKQQISRARKGLFDAIQIAASTNPSVLPSWQWVPVTPTKEMIDAGVQHTSREGEEEPYRARGEAIAAYTDMLAAAPAAPCVPRTSVDAIASAEEILRIARIAEMAFLTSNPRDARNLIEDVCEALSALLKNHTDTRSASGVGMLTNEQCAVIQAVANLGQYRDLVDGMAKVLRPHERPGFVKLFREDAAAALVGATRKPDRETLADLLETSLATTSTSEKEQGP